MSTYKLMEHERMRWETMSDKQLITRLGKITQMDKLECFTRLCREYPHRHYLLQHAANRKAQLLGLPTVPVTSVQQAKKHFYKTVTGREYAAATEITILDGDKVVGKIKKEPKPKVCDERYLDF